MKDGKPLLPVGLAMPRPYCTLFLCTLEQLTAMSVGGREGGFDASLHDMPLSLDGAGRPVLNGRTLAGALVAGARTFLSVPEEISRDGDLSDDIARPPSLWSVWNGHLLQDAQFAALDADSRFSTDTRTSTALRQDTRAPASKMMADTEVLRAGQKWRFLLEVWHPRGEGDLGTKAAAILALTLREWARERCWLGRRVARGLGWMKLADCQVIELPRTEEAVDAWPNAELSDLNEIWNAASSLKHQARMLGLEEFAEANANRAGPKRPALAYVRWPLQLATGVYEASPTGEATARSYGLDVLSIGGHKGAAVSANDLKDHLVRRDEQTWTAFESAFAPDFTVAMQPGTSVPNAPGSGVAGAWRHHLSRGMRAAGHRVLDPSTGNVYGQPGVSNDEPDPVTALFGSVTNKMAQSSRLLFKDAAMTEANWQVALLEKMALDEFTQGAFKGAKFNRMAVLHGTWQFDLV